MLFQLVEGRILIFFPKQQSLDLITKIIRIWPQIFPFWHCIVISSILTIQHPIPVGHYEVLIVFQFQFSVILS